MNDQVALFVESEAGLLEGVPASYQTLLVSTPSGVVTYNRTSNGARGRGQAWSNSTTLSNAPISKTPVAVVLTEKDIALANMGIVTNVAVKAIYASESANIPTAPISHVDMVDTLTEMLENNDPALADFITDKRRTSPIGVSQNIADTPIVEEVEVAPTNVIQELPTNPIQQDEKELVLSMITAPDPKWATQYINRKIDGITDWDYYDKALAESRNVLIEGGAGSGKTISVQAYASARGMRYFNVSNSNGIEPSQLFGGWVVREDGNGYKWQDGAVTQLVRHGGVLLLNEVNFLPARVSTVLFSLLDYRREIQLLEHGGEVIKAHKDLLIVADMNAGYKGTQALNQAFNDRFGIKLEFPYDKGIESKIVGNKALLSLADKLRDQYESEEISTPISTRSLVDFITNANTFNLDFAITSFVNGFDKEERGGVRLTCETVKNNIASDMGVTLPSYNANTTERI